MSPGVFDAPRASNALLSNQLETEHRVIDLPINVKLLPEDHQSPTVFKKLNCILVRKLPHEIMSKRLNPEILTFEHISEGTFLMV